MKTTIKKLTCAATVLALLAGCATAPPGSAGSGMGAGYVPIIDTKGTTPGQLQADLADCQGFAQAKLSEGQKAAAGAIAGALLGALLAPKGYRNEVAGRGAVIGGLSGAGEGAMSREALVKRCMSGRGYNVLD
jgi:hypothetical protein